MDYPDPNAITSEMETANHQHPPPPPSQPETNWGTSWQSR